MLTEVSLAASPASSENSLEQSAYCGVDTHTALLQSTDDQLLVHVTAREGIQWPTVLQHCHWEIRQTGQDLTHT